jgi:hypothetical protein
MNEMVKEMDYKVDICAMHEIRCPGKKCDKKDMICSGHNSDKHCNNEFGTGLDISRRIMDNVLVFEPVNGRICKIWVKLEHYNLTLISTHAPKPK